MKKQEIKTLDNLLKLGFKKMNNYPDYDLYGRGVERALYDRKNNKVIGVYYTAKRQYEK